MDPHILWSVYTTTIPTVLLTSSTLDIQRALAWGPWPWPISPGSEVPLPDLGISNVNFSLFIFSF